MSFMLRLRVHTNTARASLRPKAPATATDPGKRRVGRGIHMRARGVNELSRVPRQLLTSSAYSCSRLNTRMFHSLSTLRSSSSSVCPPPSPAPAPAPAYRTHYCDQVDRTVIGDEGRDGVTGEVRVCGWLQSKRIIGGLLFAVIRDHTGTVQVSISHRHLHIRQHHHSPTVVHITIKVIPEA